MNRQQKQEVIESLKNDFKHAHASFVVGMQGMTVQAVQQLRRELSVKQGSMRVAKNTLLIRATSDEPGLSELGPYFKDQIAIVFAHDEASMVAKVLATMAKQQEQLQLKVGTLDAQVITVEQIEFLASLPAKEVLLAQLCGALNAPIVNLVRLFNQLIIRLLWVLKEIEKKNQ